MTVTNEYESPHTPLALAGGAFALALFMGQLPILRWLVYPFQLFATLIHELSHGLAALATGGHFVAFTISADTSGLATTAGGWRWLVISAGYLGAALFGALLLVSTNRSPGPRARRWLAAGLGLFFALMTLLFARNLTAIAVGGLAALAFQVNPDVAPARIIELWKQTATKTDVGPIVNPVGFIEAVKKFKAGA